MDIRPPHLNNEGKTKSKKEKPGGEEVKETKKTNAYADMLEDPDEEKDLEEESLDDPTDEDEFDDEVPFFKTTIGKIAIGAAAVIILAIVYFVFIKKDPPPPPPPEEEAVESVDPTQALKGELYKKGIGKDQIDEKNIYDQGPIESADFRKDFVNTDSPENYALPIEIVAVNDSVSYTKHRTMTDDGMDMYWVDAMYKDKKTRFTVPYYIWQTLAPQGVMDVIAEVVTDAEGKTFVTSITAVPPNTEE